MGEAVARASSRLTALRGRLGKGVKESLKTLDDLPAAAWEQIEPPGEGYNYRTEAFVVACRCPRCWIWEQPPVASRRSSWCLLNHALQQGLTLDDPEPTGSPTKSPKIRLFLRTRILGPCAIGFATE